MGDLEGSKDIPEFPIVIESMEVKEDNVGSNAAITNYSGQTKIISEHVILQPTSEKSFNGDQDKLRGEMNHDNRDYNEDTRGVGILLQESYSKYLHPKLLQLKDTLLLNSIRAQEYFWTIRERVPIRKIVIFLKAYLRLVWDFLAVDSNRMLYTVICIMGLTIFYLNYQFQSNIQKIMDAHHDSQEDRVAKLLARLPREKGENDLYDSDYRDLNERNKLFGSKEVAANPPVGMQFLNELVKEPTEAPNALDDLPVISNLKPLPLHPLAKWFLRACSQLSLPVFLIEPKILSYLDRGGPNIKQPPTLITFGMFAHNIALLDKTDFLDTLEAEGSIVHLHMQGILPVVNGTQNKQEVDMHHILHDNTHVIHIVAFWSLKHFLYTGSLPIHRIRHGKFLSTSLDTFSFGHQAKIFDVFALKRRWTEGLLFYTPAYIDIFLWEMTTADFIPCDYERSNSYFTRNRKLRRVQHHNRNGSAMRILEAMVATKVLYKKAKRSLWLAAGSLLGWYRECGIMYYAEDADFGAWNHEFQPSDINTFLDSTHPTLKVRGGKAEEALELTFFNKNMRVDVFYFYQENNSTWIGSRGREPEDKIRETFPRFKKICSTEIYGYKFNIPCNTQAMIEAEYGPWWNSPRKSWVWYSSPENVEKYGKWNQKEMPDVFEQF